MLKIINPQLAEAGKIKIGGLGPEITSARGNAFRPPQKYDHFLITTTKRDPTGDLHVDEDMMHALAAGGHADEDGRVRQIPIVLHSDDLDQIFATSLCWYQGRQKACEGDGETARRWRFANGKRLPQYDERACLCEQYTAPKRPAEACKPHGDLRCAISLPGRGIAGAVYRWRTTSQISLDRMVGSLLQIQEVCGTIRGLPLLLKLEEIATQHGAAYVCHVELRESVIEARRMVCAEVEHRRQVRRVVETSALPSPALALPAETEAEEAEFAEEFFPEHEEHEGATSRPASPPAHPPSPPPASRLPDTGATESDARQLAGQAMRAYERAAKLAGRKPERYQVVVEQAVGRALERERPLEAGEYELVAAAYTSLLADLELEQGEEARADPSSPEAAL